MSSLRVIKPKETTNVCKEPSFGIPVVDWTSTGTIARSSVRSFKGVYSGRLTQTAPAFTASYPLVLLLATVYFLHARVYVPSTWSGGNIFIGGLGFTGASETVNVQWTAGVDAFDQWHYIETELTTAGDGAGFAHVQTSSIGLIGEFIDIDAVQVELDPVTTYCDGNQEGCKWTGLPNLSTSARSPLSFAGGETLDLETDLGYAVGKLPGMGTARRKNVTSGLAVSPGGDIQRARIPTRSGGVAGVVKGCSLADMHAKRAELNNALIDDLGQPVRILYTGAATEKFLKWHYDKGLDFTRHENFTEKMTFAGQAVDPFWYGVGDLGAVLDAQDSTAFRYIAHRAKNTGDWGNLGINTNGGTVYAIVRAPDGKVYIGGSFGQINAIANTAGLAVYDPIAGTWGAVGTGVTSGATVVRALAFDASGNLWAGGNFDGMGGIANTVKIAMWNGSAWNALGTGAASGNVFALQSSLTGLIVAGGSFPSMGGVASTAGIAWWDGSAWNSASGGITGAGEIDALAIGPNGFIYAAGTYTTIGGTPANRVAYWTGSAWVAMGTGINGQVFSLAISSAGIVYAGGVFTDAGGVVVVNIAQWNGTGWTAMGNGSAPGFMVAVMAVAPDDTLYAGGKFVPNTNNVFGRWRKGRWSSSNITITGIVTAIMTDNQDAAIPQNFDLFVGFDSAATFNHSGSVTITAPGTRVFVPIIEITRQGGDGARVISIKSETVGKEILLNYGLLDGETLTISPGAQGVISSYWGERGKAIAEQSSLVTFALRVGGNDVSCYVETTGAPVVTVTLYGSPVFAGFDG